jgi:hypothetical protein
MVDEPGWTQQKDDARMWWKLWLHKNIPMQQFDIHEQTFLTGAINIHLENIKQPQPHYEAWGKKD